MIGGAVSSPDLGVRPARTAMISLPRNPNRNERSLAQRQPSIRRDPGVVKKEARRKAGIGHYELMAGHRTAGEPRRLVERLAPRG